MNVSIRRRFELFCSSLHEDASPGDHECLFSVCQFMMEEISNEQKIKDMFAVRRKFMKFLLLLAAEALNALMRSYMQSSRL